MSSNASLKELESEAAAFLKSSTDKLAEDKNKPLQNRTFDRRTSARSKAVRRLEDFPKCTVFLDKIVSNGLDYNALKEQRVLETCLPVVVLNGEEIDHGIVYFAKEAFDADGQNISAEARELNKELKSRINKKVSYGMAPKSIMKILLDQQLSGKAGGVKEGAAISDWHFFLRDYIKNSIANNVSDIHIEIREDENRTVIRRRELGDLFEDTTLTVEDGETLIRFIYCNLAKNTDSDFYLSKPQDGSFIEKIDGKDIFVRLVTLPDMFGGDMVLRLIEQKKQDPIPLEELGYTKEQARLIRNSIGYTEGLILICGQTGSGKSYSLSNLIGWDVRQREGAKKVITIENPPEVRMGSNVTQIPVPGTTSGDPKWAQAIKACMRADPDILLVGETRDPDSAGLLIEAALTGHIALSTLHVSNALASVERLEQLGIQLAMLASPSLLRVLVYQTLLQVLCPHCKLDFTGLMNYPNSSGKYSEAVSSIQKVAKVFNHDVDKLRFRNPEGCSECKGRGVASRTVSAEVVSLNEQMFALIKNGDHLGLRQYFLDEFKTSTIEYHTYLNVISGKVDVLDALKKVRTMFEVLLRGEYV